jgi:hypothetical protein
MKNIIAITVMLLIANNVQSQSPKLTPVDTSYPEYSCADYIMKINNWNICDAYDSALFDQKIGLTPTKVNNDILPGGLTLNDDSAQYKDYLTNTTIDFSLSGVTDVTILDRGISLNGVQVGDAISSGRALFPRWKQTDAKTIMVGYGNRGGIICINYELGVITEIGYYEPL